MHIVNVSRHVGSVTTITSLHKTDHPQTSKLDNVLHAFVAPTVFS